jgi:hypothetical protein
MLARRDRAIGRKNFLCVQNLHLYEHCKFLNSAFADMAGKLRQVSNKRLTESRALIGDANDATTGI